MKLSKAPKAILDALRKSTTLKEPPDIDWLDVAENAEPVTVEKIVDKYTN